MKVWVACIHFSCLDLLQLFSIVIFGCIANEGYINRPNEVEEYCIFNRNQNACNYGVFMGSMAFLCCMALLALDIYFPQISSVKDRKKAVLADVGVSGVLNSERLFSNEHKAGLVVEQKGFFYLNPSRKELSPLAASLASVCLPVFY